VDNFGGNYTVTLASATVPISYRPTTPLTYVVTLAALDDVDNDFGFGPPSYLYLPLILRSSCSGPMLDDFSNPASGWPSGDATYLTYGYTSGEYRMYAKGSAVSAVTRGDRQQGQLIVEVDARQTSTVNGSLGLAFGITDDWSELYIFQVYPATRQYYLYRRANNQWTVMAYGTAAVIQPGSAVNRLRLVMTAPTSLDLYVNGAYLTTLAQPYDRSANRRVGLTTTSDAAGFEARFDNYKLVPEGCPANAAQVIDRVGDHPDQFFEDTTRLKRFPTQ
jgi:hypothetical protein